jgi:uncharacterized protein YjbI with pentapeptide repeats
MEERKFVSGNQLRDIIVSGENIISSKVISSRQTIQLRYETPITVQFIDCEIRNLIIDITLGVNELHFNNCEIAYISIINSDTVTHLGKLTLRNCKFNLFNLQLTKIVVGFSFIDDCVGRLQIKSDSHSDFHNIHLYKNSKLDIEITSGNFENIQLNKITESSILKISDAVINIFRIVHAESLLINLNNIKLNKETINLVDSTISHLQIENSEINSIWTTRSNLKNLQVQKSVLEKITFEDTILSLIKINESSINKLSFERSTQENGTKIVDTKIQNINLINSVFKDEFLYIIRAATSNDFILENIVLTSCDFTKGLSIYGGQREPNIQKVKHLEVNFQGENRGEINFDYLIIKEAEISGYNKQCFLKFFECDIHQLSFYQFQNSSQLSFIELKSAENWEPNIDDEGSYIEIGYASLGKTAFYNSELNSFDKIHISDSNLSEIETNGVEWFEFEKLENSYHDQNVPYSSLRETARQLKYAMEKQSNRIQALEFHKWEMIFFRKLMLYEADSKWYDRFILFLGRTNEFGLNPWKAVWIGVLVTLAAYIPIAIIGSLKFTFSPADSWSDINLMLSTIWNQFGKYPQLLNPTHTLAHIYGKDFEKLPGSIHFFDFLHRIITAFFIFQVVSAFRKYVRSSA